MIGKAVKLFMSDWSHCLVRRYKDINRIHNLRVGVIIMNFDHYTTAHLLRSFIRACTCTEGDMSIFCAYFDF